MEFTNFTFTAFNTIIFGQYTQAPEIKGVVILVHGFGEHSGRYKRHIIPALLKEGLAVVTYDNIGHGNSGGKRGHCPDYSALINILDKVVAKGMATFPSLPVFLYGHSMGGNLVLNYAMRSNRQLKAIIATSPYLRLAFAPPAWKMLIGKLMMSIWPSITLASGLDPIGISRIEAEVEKYKEDPLVHHKVSPMYSFPVIEAGAWAINNAHRLRTPAILLHGTKDPIIDPAGTQEFHHNATTTTLKLFEGGYHELHNDLCGPEMIATVCNWLRPQL